MKYSPMLCFPGKPFDGPDFIFEIKYDGTRALCYLDEETRMINRRDHDIFHRYPEFSAIRKSLKARSAVLDGEVVVFTKGKPDFPRLQTREHASDRFKIRFLSQEYPATYVVFDILELEGRDLRSLPLLERKRLLKGLLKESGAVILSEFVEGKGKALFAQARKAGFEGIIAKRKDSAYEMKRSRSWLKMKTTRTMDCIVCGFTRGESWRKETFGGLILGAYHEGKLAYIGRVGTGFDRKMLKDISAMLRPLLKEECPFGELPDMEVAVAGWVRPELVCEVEFLLVTDDLKLRAPVFHRFRDDKSPKDCTI